MREQPSGWVTVQLPKLVFFQEGPGLRKFQYRESGIPFVNIRTLVNEKVETSLCKFLDPKEVEEKYQHFLISAGDILCSTSGSIGKTAIVYESDLPLMLNTSVIRFRTYDANFLINRFIYYFLKSEAFLSQANQNATGTAQKNIGPSHLQEFYFPLPPLNEQIRIADKLDSVLAKVDAAQARLEKTPILLKRFRQSVLAAATSGELTDTEPEGKDSIGNTCEVIGGLTKNKQRESISQQLPYLRVANVYENELRLQDILKIGVFDKELERVVLRKDDLLIVEGNGSIDQVGRVALWDDSISPCVHQNHLIKVRVNSEILLPKYLLYYLMSPKGKEEIVGKATSGAGLYTLSISKISSIKVAIFTVEQQKEIVRRVESLFTLADTVEKQYLETKKRLDRLTQSLLAKAFRGELVPQDPNDEPASELLARIKASRSTEAPKQTRKPATRKTTRLTTENAV
jgi:type I restriction enzyme S subunit